MIQTINLGQAANDGTGEPLRQGGQKINANFAELDTRVTDAQAKADAAQPKVAGKGLSTNDYDNTEKAKVTAAIPNTQKGVANGVASLGADGKLPVSQLPPLAVNEVFTVANQAAMLALTAERGDAAIRTDQNGQWYVLTTDDPSVLGNWKPISQNLGVALTALGALTPAADTLPYFNGTATASTTAFTAKARTVLAFTTNAQWQSELGLVPVASVTDNTAGRLMTVGFIGFGGALGVALPSSNANVALPSGSCYATPATWTGSPYAGTDGRNQGYLYTTVWSAGNYMLQRWIGLNPAWGSFQRHYVNGVWQDWVPAYDGNNATIDPVFGGLMNLTTVSGFYVFKYANGKVCIMGDIPLTGTIAANTNATFDVTVPSIINGSFISQASISLVPTSSNDIGGSNAMMASLTIARIHLRNGATAQTFRGQLTIWGRWK